MFLLIAKFPDTRLHCCMLRTQDPPGKTESAFALRRLAKRPTCRRAASVSRNYSSNSERTSSESTNERKPSRRRSFRRARTGSTPHRCHSANNSPAKLWCSISGRIVASTASTFSPTSSSWRNATPGIRWHSSVCTRPNLKTKRSPRTFATRSCATRSPIRS